MKLLDFSENVLLERTFSYLIAFGLVFQILGLLLVVDGSVYSTNVSTFLMIPSLLALVLYRESASLFFKSFVSKLLVGFLAYVLIYAGFTSESIQEFKKWLKICFYILLYLHAFYFLMRVNIKLFDKLGLLIVIISSVFAWATIINVFFIDGASFAYRSVRLTELGFLGLADLKNALVSALYYGAISIFALFYLFRVEGYLNRILLLVSLIGLCLYVLFTYSRSVWMALFFSYLVFMSISFGNLKKYIAIFFVAFIVFSLVIKLELYPGLKFSLTYRDLIWEEWFARLRSFWLIGEGPGAEFNVCIDIPGRNCFNQAHNLYMQLFYELGILGFLLFVSMVTALVVFGIKNISNSYFLLGFSWLVFAILAGMSSYHAILTRPSVYWIVVWIPIAIILYVISINSKESTG